MSRTIALMMMLLCLGAPVRAAEDVFVVHGAGVDVTARNAAAARDAAIQQGHERALAMLMARMVLPEDGPRLPHPAFAEIADMVEDFQVEQEQTTAVRYIASLTFRFRAEDVRALLRGAGIPFAETASRPVVVIPVYRPVYRKDGALLLWEDGNPWRAAWQDLKLGDPLVPLILPKGDDGDRAALSPEKALAGDVAALVSRYGTSEALVALATEGGAVTATRFGAGGTGMTPPGVNLSATYPNLAAAAEGTANALEAAWKQNNLIREEQIQTLAVGVPIRDLKDWLGLRRRLSDVTLIRHIDLTALSKHEAQLSLAYRGNTDQLRQALAQSDLALSQDQGGWRLAWAAR